MPADMATGSAAEIEEERRLLYVAMTRAKDELSLWVPQRFHVTQQRAWGDRHLYALRSRFVPPELLLHFDVVDPVPPPVAGARPGDSLATPLFDLAAALRGTWHSRMGSGDAPGPADPGQNPG
jgi:DNA helicase-2/ATP-dependent DNA helicase PcrA